jgi:L-alanine-DL-glutamate epimerase-like enolase superfamily enzyme
MFGPTPNGKTTLRIFRQEAKMISAKQISDAFDEATREFAATPSYLALIAGQAVQEEWRDFIGNVFRTHYLSSHIVALCFASLPSNAAALLQENLMEEMGRSETEKPHSALLLELARGAGFSEHEIEGLIADAQRQIAIFCATKVPLPTLRELCLSVLLETMSFEFMLSRCSSQISTALAQSYGLSQKALQWFELHSEVDIRHAEEGLEVIQDYIRFHEIADSSFKQILRATCKGNIFSRHYFPPSSRVVARHGTTPAGAKRIESLTIYRLRIPFRKAFTHALQSREESDAVVVRVKDADGQVGYGEALPRPYVTGESAVSMVSHIRQHLAPKIFNQTFTPGWETFDYLRSVLPEWTRSDDHGSRIIAWNAAFCAVELALLDWTLSKLNVPLSDFFPPARKEVIYSGVISADRPQEAATLAKRFQDFGIRQIKVKVGTGEDVARLQAVRRAVGEHVELRADANGAWSAEEAVERLKLLQPFKLAVIEQPVGANDFEGLRRVRNETAIPVMADESLVTIEQARRLIELHACDHFNIRVSKCGGITGSLAIANLAKEAGIQIQIGAQVGETGILSAAGRTLAAFVSSLAFAEGSFGTWLLTEDVTFENVAFGYGGAAPLLRTRGLSVTVKEEALESMAVEKVELRR